MTSQPNLFAALLINRESLQTATSSSPPRWRVAIPISHSRLQGHHHRGCLLSANGQLRARWNGRQVIADSHREISVHLLFGSLSRRVNPAFPGSSRSFARKYDSPSLEPAFGSPIARLLKRSELHNHRLHSSQSGRLVNQRWIRAEGWWILPWRERYSPTPEGGWTRATPAVVPQVSGSPPAEARLFRSNKEKRVLITMQSMTLGFIMKGGWSRFS